MDVPRRGRRDGLWHAGFPAGQLVPLSGRMSVLEECRGRGERVQRKGRPDEERPVELKSHLRDWHSSAGSECSTTRGQEGEGESDTAAVA